MTKVTQRPSTGRTNIGALDQAQKTEAAAAPEQTSEATPETQSTTRDGFETGGTAKAAKETHPAISADEELTGELSARRAAHNAGGTIAHGRGTLAVPARNRRAGERYARAERNNAIDWNEPEVSLNSLSQVDSNRATRNDATRCGAAAITAGLVLIGPEQMNLAQMRLNMRIHTLRGNIEGGAGRNVESQRRELDRAESLLDGLPENEREWTAQHGQQFQEAMYLTAAVDENQTIYPNSGRDRDQPMNVDGGLGTPTVNTYRDFLWGKSEGGVHQPTYQDAQGTERNADVFFAGGHFVLGTGTVGSRDTNPSVLFDPLPQLANDRFTAQDPIEGDAGSAYTDALDNETSSPIALPTGAEDSDAVPGLHGLTPAQVQQLRRSNEGD